MLNFLAVPTAILVLFLAWGSVRADDNERLPAAKTHKEVWLTKLKGNADAVEVDGKILKFQFNEIPKSGELRFPRLYARLESVYWMGQPDKLSTLKPGTTEWTVKLANPPKGKKVLVIQLLDVAPPGTRGLMIHQMPPPRETELPAHFSQPHGDKLRYEPQPHKNTVGYWTNPEDWVSWSLAIMSRQEKFHVDILQGCGTGQGGSEVRVLITQGKKTVDEISFVVEDTGHFQNFKKRRIGTVSFPTAGNYQLEIRPVKLANKAVMDVRKVILVPVQDEK